MCDVLDKVENRGIKKRHRERREPQRKQNGFTGKEAS